MASAVTAESAAQRKETKYAEISKTHLFFPLAVETMDPISREGKSSSQNSATVFLPLLRILV
jgi:hypothetical protein